MRKIVTHQYRLLNAQLLPLLAAREILLVRAEELTAKQRRWVTKTFSREIFPVLTPIAVDPAHPFPTVANKGLHFIVELCLTQGGVASRVVIVKVSRGLPRLIEMHAGEAAHQRAYILLSTLIECEMGRLFPG